MSGLYKTEIETTLDEMLAYNMNEASNGTNRFKNVLFIGASGVGKTAIVLKWLQRANDNLGVNCCGESFYRTHTVSADNLKLLEDATDGRPNTILFIDEFDAAPKMCRDTLTDIIDNHTYVVDGVEKHLDGLLFVIATARPAYADYSDGHGIPHIVLPDIDPKNYPIEGSEQERFNTVHVYNDKRSCLEDIERRLDGIIKYVAERGRSSKGFEKTARRDLRRYLGCKSLAEAILKNPNFRFQSEEGDIKALEVKARINRVYFMYTFSARDMSNFIVGCFGTRQDLEQYLSEKYIYDLEVGLEASLMGYEDPDFDKEIEEILNAVDDDD